MPKHVVVRYIVHIVLKNCVVLTDNYINTLIIIGAWGSTVVKATVLLVGRSRDRIPLASFTGIFLVDTDRTMCPEVNSTSKKWVPGIPLVVKAAGAWGWRTTILVVPNVKKSGDLTYPDPLGTSRRPVVGETFTFTFYLLSYQTFKAWYKHTLYSD